MAQSGEVGTAASATWRMAPSASDIRACLRNGKRLRKDALRCRSPARLALLELALEQLALGAMLVLRALLDTSELGRALRRGADVEKESVTVTGWPSALRNHLLDLNDDSIGRAFRGHPGSLTQLKFVFGLLQEVVPAALLSEGYPFPTKEEIPPRYRATKFLLTRPVLAGKLVSRFRENVSRLSNLDLKRLDVTVKNKSLYVRIEKATGHVTLPSGDEDVAATLTFACRTLEGFLLGAARMMEHRTSTRNRS